MLVALVLVSIDLCNGILHPSEEERVHGLDVVGRLGLLHSEVEVFPLLRALLPKPRTRGRVPILAAVEVCLAGAAAVHAHGPKVIECLTGVSPFRGQSSTNGDGSHAVSVPGCKGHAHVGREPRPLCEVHPTGIHEAIPVDIQRIDVRVRLQGLEKEEGLREVPVVQLAGDDSARPGQREQDYAELLQPAAAAESCCEGNRQDAQQ
mmetsp:Transcript_112907/g.251982  ORF Transcript_112907/g.251982 Transcript_112907/m.251982 type:complete len:206 (-) Transcript_112907:409-1026(-)